MKSPSQLRIHLRFARYLLWEFRRPLGTFAALVLVGGLALHKFYHIKGDLSYVEACYNVFLMLFFQAQLGLPAEWYLQPLFFLLPILGLWALADSVVRAGYLIFAQKRNLPEWQRMVASLYRNHIIVVGVGRVGYRIIKALVEQREAVVAVERQAESEFLDVVHDLGVPVVTGNARQAKTLEEANIRQARSIVLATDDDLANLDSALTARDLNPAVRVVLRLFDDTLATKFAAAFAMPAISTSQVSAPAFIAAATGRTVYHEFQVGGQHLHLIDLTVSPRGALAGRTLAEVQAAHGVNVMLHRGPSGLAINPAADVRLGPEDTVLVIAPVQRLVELEASNRGEAGDTPAAV
jgi:Trk K+ transport system NAD-binding subunit